MNPEYIEHLGVLHRMDNATLKAAFLTFIGWCLGFLTRYVEARWKAADSLRGALRACMEDVRALTTHEVLGEEPAPSLALPEEDSVRLRDVLVANPRFGNEFWVLYRRLRQVTIAEAETSEVPDTRLFFTTFRRLLKQGTVGLFLPFADGRVARLRSRIAREPQRALSESS